MVSIILLLTAIVVAVLILTQVVAWFWFWVFLILALAIGWPIFQMWYIIHIYKKKYDYDTSVEAFEHFKRELEAKYNRCKK